MMRPSLFFLFGLIIGGCIGDPTDRLPHNTFRRGVITSIQAPSDQNGLPGMISYSDYFHYGSINRYPRENHARIMSQQTPSPWPASRPPSWRLDEILVIFRDGKRELFFSSKLRKGDQVEFIHQSGGTGSDVYFAGKRFDLSTPDTPKRWFIHIDSLRKIYPDGRSELILPDK